MLTKEIIKALLEIDTENTSDNRILRILSCDTPIKDVFLYHYCEVKKEFNQDPKNLDDRLILCILKFNTDLYRFLIGEKSEIYTKNCAIKLDKDIIQNALNELYKLYYLLKKVAIYNDYSLNTLTELENLKISNYIAILQICGIVNIDENIYRSKLLSRFFNIKEQVKNYLDEKMIKTILSKEFSSHFKYISRQVQLLEKYNIANEDFIIFTIIFDIRHYKNSRRIVTL